jgi:hypothetical protein
MAKITFTSASGGTEIGDLLLRKIPELPIDEFTIQKMRFGIHLPADTERFEGGVLRVSGDPDGSGWFSASSRSLGLNVNLPAQVYKASIPGTVTKGRFVNECLEATIDFNTRHLEWSFNLDSAQTLSLEKCVRILKFGHIMMQEDAALAIELEHLGAVPIPHGDLRTEFKGWGLLKEFLEMIYVAQIRYKPDLQITLNMDDVLAALKQNKDMFSLMARPGVKITSSFDDAARETFSSLSEATYVLPILLDILEWQYWAVVSIRSASLTVNENTFTFVGDLPRIVADGFDFESDVVARDLHDRVRQVGKRLRAVPGSFDF